MSAVCGVFHRVGSRANPAGIDSMLETMADRSPDGRTVRCSGTVGLGHGALQTTPESLDESLPLATPEGLLITGDLRIDNRSELLRDLSIDSADGRDVGNAELVRRT